MIDLPIYTYVCQNLDNNFQLSVILSIEFHRLLPIGVEGIVVVVVIVIANCRAEYFACVFVAPQFPHTVQRFTALLCGRCHRHQWTANVESVVVAARARVHGPLLCGW